jgi:DNA polymerase III subunit delta'
MSCLPWHEVEFGRLLAARSGLPHALMLHGAQGIGKLAFAHALTQALLCEAPAPAGSACGTCAGCGWFTAGTHPDWLALEPENGRDDGDAEQGGEKKGGRQITVDQVRLLTDFINLSSHRGGRKVITVHPAEVLNANAANALLKSLEEPPPDTYFLLVTHRPRFVPPTIKSRCRQLPLPGPAHADAMAWLKSQKVVEPVLALAQSGNAPLLAARVADAAWWQQRAILLDAIAKPGFDPLAVAEQVRDIPLPNLVGWLQKWSFDMILNKFLGKTRYNPDYADALAAGAKESDARALLQYHRHVVGMQRIVNHPLNPRLAIEDLLLAYSQRTPPG